MAADTWNPERYEQFKAERSQPFFDLAQQVDYRPGMRIVDLGCGTGELTRRLHDMLRAANTLGVDSSASMLAKATPSACLAFEQRDLREVRGTYDLVFSNAALQWVPDHPSLFRQLVSLLAPGGQVAIQVPSNHDHPSHRIADTLIREAPFAEASGGFTLPTSVLPLEQYATILHEHGFLTQRVSQQVYLHVLPNAGAVADWVQGTLLTAYQAALPAELWPRFLAEYRERLGAALGGASPYPFAFKRTFILGWR